VFFGRGGGEKKKISFKTKKKIGDRKKGKRGKNKQARTMGGERNKFTTINKTVPAVQ